MSWCHSRRQSSNYSQCQAKTRCEDAAKQVGSPKRQKLKIKSQHRKEKWQLPRPKMERTSNAQSPTALVRALERTTRAVCVCFFFPRTFSVEKSALTATQEVLALTWRGWVRMPSMPQHKSSDGICRQNFASGGKGKPG